jgi:hypothetical protein
MMKGRIIVSLFLWTCLFGMSIPVQAEESVVSKQGTLPFSSEPDTYERSNERIFPLLRDKLNLKEREKELPPPFGVMYLTNWMDSDWEFQSAEITLRDGGTPVSIDAAQGATMDLQIQTNGAKADLWVLPFLNLMVAAGRVDVDVQLGLQDVPVDVDIVGSEVSRGDLIVPMNFSGDYYSFGGVLAGAYKRLYGAVDMSWVKTSLEGDASLSADGFWTFTAAPKFGYNAGLSQVYVGARYISKNERYQGNVVLPSGDNMGFDVKIKTDSWSPNFGVRTVIREHWEILMESSIGARH